MQAGIVDPRDLGVLAKLKARLGLYSRYGHLFLGYCEIHKKYFLDREHTNGDIRCPICDDAWLKKWILS